MRYLIGLVLLLTACESDTQKLQRLDSEKVTSCLLEQAATRKLDAIPAPSTASEKMSPEYAAALKEWSDAKTRCDLATRDYDRFMK